ncbi:MAG: hypothetical protein LBB23_00100 [Rickettsiales bacterium]|nr:hypothetical protein [Rickettsiales bacterium]
MQKTLGVSQRRGRPSNTKKNEGEVGWLPMSCPRFSKCSGRKCHAGMKNTPYVFCPLRIF